MGVIVIVITEICAFNINI